MTLDQLQRIQRKAKNATNEYVSYMQQPYPDPTRALQLKHVSDRAEAEYSEAWVSTRSRRRDDRPGAHHSADGRRPASQ